MTDLITPPMHLSEVNKCSYANIGRRLGAYGIDAILNLSVLIIVGLTLRFLSAVGVWIPGGVRGVPTEVLWAGLGISSKLLVLSAFFVSLGPVYSAMFESSPWQATLGKRLFGIYVAKSDGTPISSARALGRHIAKLILNAYLLVVFSFLTMVVRTDRKGLHDFVARTVVLNGRPAMGAPIESWRVVVSFAFPLIWTFGTFLLTL